jgi:hypothetical protein
VARGAHAAHAAADGAGGGDARQKGDLRGSLGDAKSSLGDAKSSLGDAESPLGDAESSLGDAESSLGDAKSSLGDAKSSLGDANNSLGDAKSSLGDAESSLGDSESSLGDSESSLGDAGRHAGGRTAPARGARRPADAPGTWSRLPLPLTHMIVARAEGECTVRTVTRRAVQRRFAMRREVGVDLMQVATRLAGAVCVPLFHALRRWLFLGELDDPHHELFVTADPSCMDEDLWWARYRVAVSAFPRHRLLRTRTPLRLPPFPREGMCLGWLGVSCPAARHDMRSFWVAIRGSSTYLASPREL